MKTFSRIAAPLAALALALSLGACGGAGGLFAPAEDVISTEISVDKPFEGSEARDASELDAIVDEATTLATDRRDAVPDDAEEGELNAKVNNRFSKGNASYEEGDYAKAQERYEKILEIFPKHYGANVNLTLALLQQEKNDEALVQALACHALFADQAEPLLNVQVAGVTCGFAMDDLEDAMNRVAPSGSDNVELLRAKMDSTIADYYEYNKIWSNMETELHGAATGSEEDAAATESEEAAATESEETATESEEAEAATESEDAAATESEEEEKRTPREAYNDMDSRLDSLESVHSSDTDYSALHAYLFAVGLQLGYRYDPTLIEPAHTMPFVVVDDEHCTIRAVEITGNDNEWYVGLQFTGKDSEQQLRMESLGTWATNGTATSGYINGSASGEEDGPTHILVLENPGVLSGEGESTTTLSSFMGQLVVLDYDGDEVARYPVSWEGEAEIAED